MIGQQIIQHLDDVLRIRSRKPVAIIYMRESTWKQRRKNNLRNRHLALRKRAREKGVGIMGQYCEVISGKSLATRPQLRGAIEAAERHQRENPDLLIFVLTDCRNRLLRGRFYNGQPQTDIPDERQWAELGRLASSVTLATLLNPDAPFEKTRRYENRVAAEAGKQNGRPRKKPKPLPGVKKEIRERMKPRVMKLRHRGESIRAIARRFDLPLSTVGGWAKQRS